MITPAYYDSRLVTLPPKQHPTCCLCGEPVAAYANGNAYCERHALALVQCMPDQSPPRYGVRKDETS